MREFAEVAYACFALQQPLDLAELAAGAREHRLPMADAQTPDWFAAAASTGSSLLDMAPELVVLPTDLDAAERVDVGGIDLVRMYAPELAALEDDGAEVVPEPVVPTTDAPKAQRDRSSVKFDLLKELADLED